MTMLWLSGSGEMTVVRSHRNERMFYACNPNVTVSRAPSLRIQVLQVRYTGAAGTIHSMAPKIYCVDGHTCSYKFTSNAAAKS